MSPIPPPSPPGREASTGPLLTFCPGGKICSSSMVKWSQTGEGCRRMNRTAVTWSTSHSICRDEDEGSCHLRGRPGWCRSRAACGISSKKAPTRPRWKEPKGRVTSRWLAGQSQARAGPARGPSLLRRAGRDRRAAAVGARRGIGTGPQGPGAVPGRGQRGASSGGAGDATVTVRPCRPGGGGGRSSPGSPPRCAGRASGSSPAGRSPTGGSRWGRGAAPARSGRPCRSS